MTTIKRNHDDIVVFRLGISSLNGLSGNSGKAAAVDHIRRRRKSCRAIAGSDL